MNIRAPFGLALPAVLCTGGLALLAAPASADHAPDHLHALEVFAPHGEPETQAPCGEPVAVPGMADAADLPAGTTAAIALEGPLHAVEGDDTCRVWWIGGYPVAAPFGADPAVPPGTVVRIVGAAEVATPTTIVASRTRVGDEPTVGSGELDLAYLAPFTIVAGDRVVDEPLTGDCVEVPEDVWTVREQESDGLWQLDVAAARSAGEVERCFQAGDAIEAEFDLVPAPVEGGSGLVGQLPVAGPPVAPAPEGTEQTGGGLLTGLTGEQSPLGGVTGLVPVTGGLLGGLLP